jgi:hypothetical protein
MRNVVCFILIIITVFATNAQQVMKNLTDDSKNSGKEVYVVGKVLKPAKIPYQESISLLSAIHQAGGTIFPEENSSAIIIKYPPNCKFATQMSIDLRDVLSNKVVDPVLESFDIIKVEKRTKNYQRNHILCKNESLPTVIYHF